MPKFYTPTFASPVVSLDASRATPRDLVPHEKAMLAHDGRLVNAPIAKPSPSPCSLEALDLAALRAEDERRARRERIRAELEAARAENARLKAVQVGARTHLVPPTTPYVDPTIDDSVTAFQKAQIDAMVAQLLADGAIAFDAETDQYVRPRSAVWCFNGPRPWALD